MNETTETLLFVDDHEIMYRGGTRRVLHPPVRHPGNPLIAGRDKPWEVALAYNSVYRDPDSGRYQMWYQAGALGAAPDRAHQCVVCYAESEDGLHWDKPNLGVHAFGEEKDTNIVLIGSGLGSRYGCSVVVDPGDSGDRRYKMAYYDHGYDASGQVCAGLFVAFSPDGIHWHKYPDDSAHPDRAASSHRPVLAYWGAWYGDRIPLADEIGAEYGVLRPSDALDAIWDPNLRRWVIYTKIWLNTPEGTYAWKRGVGRVTSEDFLHWSDLEVVLYPDEFDPPGMEMHHAPVFYHQGCYFGLMQRTDPQVRGGIMDIELVISRDGLRFERPFRDEMFIPLAAGGEREWDGGSIFSNATPIRLEDELRLYYGGYSQGTLTADDTRHISGVGLATLQLHRFAGLRPLQYSGVVSLKPRDLSRYRTLRLDAEINQGRILCEITHRSGFRVRGYTREEAVPVVPGAPVQWREKSLEQLPPGEYMLQIYLQNAEVFAATLEA